MGTELELKGILSFGNWAIVKRMGVGVPEKRIRRMLEECDMIEEWTERPVTILKDS